MKIKGFEGVFCEKARRAFSLIELSVVLLIVSILAAGAAGISTVLVTKKRYEVTQKRIEVIYNAMGQYLLKNYALPCPSPLNFLKTSSSYGTAGTAGSCNEGGIYASTLASDVVYGGVPFKTLGIDEEYGEDGFGTKFSYVINKNYTTAEFPTAVDNNGFSYNDGVTAMMYIYSNPSASYVPDVMFALISHGANKYGGFPAHSTMQNTAPTNDYEIDNYVSSITDNSYPTADTGSFGVNASYPTYVTFASHDHTSDEFDDLILYKRRNDFLVEFDAYFLSVCDSSDSNWTTGYSDSFAGGLVYNSTACLSPHDSIYPAKECSPFGNYWINRIQCP